MLGISFTEGRARGLRTPSPQLLLREENNREQPCRPVSTPPVISHQNNNYSEAHTQYIHVHVNADGHLDRQQIQKTVSSKGNKMMCFNTCVSWLIELFLSSLTCHKPPIASTVDLTIMKWQGANPKNTGWRLALIISKFPLWLFWILQPAKWYLRDSDTMFAWGRRDVLQVCPTWRFSLVRSTIPTVSLVVVTLWQQNQKNNQSLVLGLINRTRFSLPECILKNYSQISQTNQSLKTILCVVKEFIRFS